MMPFFRIPQKTLFLSLSLSLLMTSCAPMTVDFYRPSAPEGRVVRQHCPPVGSVMLIEKGGVIISTSASFSTADQISVTLGFEVPEGMVVTLVDHKIVSLTGEQVFASSDLSGQIWISRGQTSEFWPDSPMMGKTEKKFLWPGTHYGKTDHAFYWFSARLSVPDSDIFILKLPIININDSPVQLPLIKFIRDKRSYIGSLNC